MYAQMTEERVAFNWNIHDAPNIQFYKVFYITDIMKLIHFLLHPL